MAEWKEHELGEIIDVRDGTHDSPKEKSEGKYLITSRHIKNGKIDLSKAYKISFEDFEQVNKRSKVDKWDILFSMIGTVGEIALIDFEPDFAIKNIGLFKTGDEDLAKWIIYYLKSTEAQNEIFASLKGSTQQYITLGDLRKFPILLPPLPEQKAIASVLSSLDDKIDLLHRQNKTLEAMAETLFRQWFVEEAQEDWEDGCLGDIADINPTYQLKKGEIAPYLEMRNVRTSTFNPEGWAKREFSSGMKFQNGDTLLARITPCLENGKTCFVMFLDDGEIGWGSTEYIVIRMRKQFHPFISYIIAKDKDFRDFAISSMSGSSGRQRAQANVIKEYDLKIPPLPAIEGLNRQFAEILPKLEKNSNQIRTLEKLRDILLPKLMSGEVRVAYNAN